MLTAWCVLPAEGYDLFFAQARTNDMLRGFVETNSTHSAGLPATLVATMFFTANLTNTCIPALHGAMPNASFHVNMSLLYRITSGIKVLPFDQFIALQAATGASPVKGRVLTHQALQPGQATAVGPLRYSVL